MRKTKLLVICSLMAVCLVFLAGSLVTQSFAGDTPTSQADVIKRGTQVYKARCSICHLPEGASPNKRMRFSDKEWKHGDKPEEVARVVSDGIKGTAMMGFKSRLAPDDIKAVTAYILDLSAHSK